MLASLTGDVPFDWNTIWRTWLHFPDNVKKGSNPQFLGSHWSGEQLSSLSQRGCGAPSAKGTPWGKGVPPHLQTDRSQRVGPLGVKGEPRQNRAAWNLKVGKTGPGPDPEVSNTGN